MSDPLKLLELAERAAVMAGRHLASIPVADRLTESSEGRDIKLRADVTSEQIILDEITRQSDYPVLAEESGHSNANPASSSGRIWVVDPLDGSMNYKRGIDLCCVSIGLLEDDEAILGVVYDFNRDEVFVGASDHGATCNGSPVYVGNVEVIDQAVLATGFPVSFSFEPAEMSRYLTQFRRYKKIRMIGSAALSLAWLACGRVDVYSERAIKKWDVAAGLALVVAAGGSYTMSAPAGGSSVDVLAASSRSLFE